MSAGKYNLSIEQGSVYGFELTLSSDDGTIWDLTDYVARLQIRDKVGGTVLYDSDTLMDITIAGVEGKVTLSIPTARTSLFTFDTGVYDLDLKKDNENIRILEGSVYLSKEVTKDVN